MPLVGSVAAIVHPVALHSLGNAPTVSAWKKEIRFSGLFVGRLGITVNLLAREFVLIAPSLAAVRFVGSVQAIWQAVAEASSQYALPVAARKLVFRGTRWHQNKRCERFTRPCCQLNKHRVRFLHSFRSASSVRQLDQTRRYLSGYRTKAVESKGNSSSFERAKQRKGIRSAYKACSAFNDN